MSVKQEVLDLIDEELERKLQDAKGSESSTLITIAQEIGLLQLLRKRVEEVKDDSR